MSNLAKCQFTITLCLQSKNLQRPESISFRVFVFVFYTATKNGNIFTFTVSLFLFLLTTRVSRYV